MNDQALRYSGVEKGLSHILIQNEFTSRLRWCKEQTIVVVVFYSLPQFIELLSGIETKPTSTIKASLHKFVDCGKPYH